VPKQPADERPALDAPAATTAVAGEVDLRRPDRRSTPQQGRRSGDRPAAGKRENTPAALVLEGKWGPAWPGSRPPFAETDGDHSDDDHHEGPTSFLDAPDDGGVPGAADVTGEPRLTGLLGGDETLQLQLPGQERGAGGEGDEEDLWEQHAGWWQDGFTDGVDPEYEEQILPLAARFLAGARTVLDIGCGEGQVARLARELGAATVVGIDPTWAQVSVAARRGGGAHYLRSAAAALPFPDATFDVAVACLVFEHIHEVDEAIAEVARVLRPGGRFAFFLNHPLLQTPNSGWIDDQILDPPEQYWRIGPYLIEDESLEEVEKDVFIPFIHRPLSRYVNALAVSGLVITRMEEPAPPPGFLAKAHEYEDAATIPRLLVLVTEKRA
jgi:SAM-dependent methyltransferase